MDFGDFLFHSEPRKKLLASLFFEELELSAFDLAHLTGAGYATVREELMRLEKAGVLSSRKEKRAVLYKSCLDAKRRSALKTLLGYQEENPQQDTPLSAEAVKTSLVEHGAPLVETKAAANPSPPAKLGLEETLVRAAGLAKDDPSVARSLPVVLFRYSDTLDYDRLFLLAKKTHLKQEVGFFLALTAELSKQRKLGVLARKLKDHRVKAVRDFFSNQSSTPLQKKLAEQNTPALAKTWKFRLNMSLATFQSTFDRFAKTAEA